MTLYRCTSAIKRWVFSFVVSVIVTYFVGSISQSLFVVAALEGAGADISVGILLKVLLHDLMAHTANGMYSYGFMILVGFGIAMPVATFIHKLLRMPKLVVYPLAGGAAIATIIFIVNSNYFYNMSFFAGTRSLSGYLSQLVAGGLGGMFFAVILNHPRASGISLS